MAINDTHFEFADRGATSLYKFVVRGDPAVYVWFENEDGGSLYTTPHRGPYRVEHELTPATEFGSLDALLEARGTTKQQWVDDLMAQFGERLAWSYP